jgi:hypothetical protein
MMKRNRSHSKIDQLPSELREAINDAIVNKRMTYKEITLLIKEAGHDISQKSVERYGKKFLTKLESISRAKEQARSIIETSAGLKLDMAEASSMVAFQLLMDMLVNADSENIDKNTLAAIRTLATLERSAVSREKLKFEFDKGVDAAVSKVKESLSKELKQHPELLERINSLVEKIENDLKG